MDAIADKLTYTYYQPEITRQSLQAFQRGIKVNTLRAKRSACEVFDATDLIECQSEVVSEFYNSTSPYIAMWDDMNQEVIKILYRGAYSINDVIDCYCMKYTCGFENTLAALQGNSGLEKFRNNAQHFFVTLKNDCDYNPRRGLIIGANTREFTSNFAMLFPYADMFMIESNHEEESQLKTMCSSSASPAKQNPPDRTAGPIFHYEIADFMSDSKRQRVSVKSIDSIMDARHYSNVDFLCIDARGAELSTLKSAMKTLQSVEVIQLEIYFDFSVQMSHKSPSFYGLHEFLDSVGFALKDQGNVNRDHNDELTSMTTFFVRKSSKLWSESCSLFPPRQGYASDSLSLEF